MPGLRGLVCIASFFRLVFESAFGAFFLFLLDFGRVSVAKMEAKIDFFEVCFRCFFRVRFFIEFGSFFGGSEP